MGHDYRWRQVAFVALTIALFAIQTRGEDLAASMKLGNPGLKSVGPLAFTPGGILLLGDPTAGAVFAIDAGDRERMDAPGQIMVEQIDSKVATLLQVPVTEVRIVDMAVNPASRKAYLSISYIKEGRKAAAVLRVGQQGSIELLGLDEVRFAKALLESDSRPPGDLSETMTDLTYVNGRVFVANISVQSGGPVLRAASFPLNEAARRDALIPSSGPLESRSRVRTLAPDAIENEPSLLAGFFSTGVTSSREGEAPRPADSDPQMPEGRLIIQTVEASPYQAIDSMKGIQKLDRLDGAHALVLIRSDSGYLNLETVPLF